MTMRISEANAAMLAGVQKPSRRKFLLAIAGLAAGLANVRAAQAAGECVTSQADILGPFHRPGAPFGTKLAADEEPGVRLRLSGQVLASDCSTPIAGAIIDVWQADAEGKYDWPDYINVVDTQKDYRLRGQLMTDKDGRYAIETIVPGRYPVPPGVPQVEHLAGQTRPAHIHLIAISPGFQALITQIYFAGDPFLTVDPWAQNSTNIVTLAEAAEGGKAGTYDIVLARA